MQQKTSGAKLLQDRARIFFTYSNSKNKPTTVQLLGAAVYSIHFEEEVHNDRMDQVGKTNYVKLMHYLHEG